jgi:hypothetical protein
VERITVRLVGQRVDVGALRHRSPNPKEKG